MKNKLLFILTLLILMFGIGSVKAEEKLINFSCDYQFEGIKFRVKVLNLEQKYIKDSQQITTASTSDLNNRVFLYYEDNNGNFQLDTTSTGIDQYKGYSNSKKKMKLFYSQNSYGKKSEKSNFLVNATKGGKINCPQLYYFIEESSNEKYVVSSFSSHREYTDDGSASYDVDNSAVTFLSKNCYKNGTDTTPITCEEVETGELYSDDNLECVYSSNRESVKFKLIYDKKQDKLYFDGLGKNFAWITETFKQDGDNTLVIEEKMRSIFKGSESCPKRIYCSCSQINGCFFNKIEKENAKCGQLQSENGDESAGLNPSGGSPDSPDGWKIFEEDMTCEELLGSNLTKVVNVGVTAVRVIGALAMIIFGITAYIPAVSGDDPEMLKKANSKAIKMGIVLIVILLLPSLVKVIGNIFDFDLTCLI